MRYPAADHVSKREWVVLAAFLCGFAVSVALIAGTLVVLVFRALSN